MTDAQWDAVGDGSNGSSSANGSGSGNGSSSANGSGSGNGSTNAEGESEMPMIGHQSQITEGSQHGAQRERGREQL